MITTFLEYEELAARTVDRLQTNDENLLNAVLGLVGEAGEIADYYKKFRHHGHTLDKLKLLKEAGDCLWYLALLSKTLESELGAVAQLNIDKLRARYPAGFSSERSINRDNFEERDE